MFRICPLANNGNLDTHTAKPTNNQHPHPPPQAANGKEPDATWPSGLVAPLMDEGEPHCADYAYAKASPGYALRAARVELAGAAPAPSDATLFASDHVGLHVCLALSRRGRRGGSGGGAAAAETEPALAAAR